MVCHERYNEQNSSVCVYPRALASLVVLLAISALASPRMDAASISPLPVVNEHSQASRYALVGIIAGNRQNAGINQAIGIAVLKDSDTESTVTVAIGDSLPGSKGLRVVDVSRTAVSLSDGQQTYTIGYPSAPSVEQSPLTDVEEIESPAASDESVVGNGRYFDEPLDFDEAELLELLARRRQEITSQGGLPPQTDIPEPTFNDIPEPKSMTLTTTRRDIPVTEIEFEEIEIRPFLESSDAEDSREDSITTDSPALSPATVR